MRIGDLPTSKPLRTWLAGLEGVRQIALDPESAWQDPASVVTERMASDPAATLAGAEVSAVDPDWLAGWRAADAAVAAAVAPLLEGQCSEPAVARWLAEQLGPDATLFVASSMPVRDLEEFMPAADAAPRILANRGANGIDGTVSSAFGAAAVAAGPVVLLIGDVALAHDMGGLLAARRLPLSLTIVLINNDGGGIFHFLPVAGERDAFEEHVATPHGLPFALAAELYGCAYARVEGLAALAEAVDAAGRRTGTTIIEVPSDREANLALHRRIAAASSTALSGALR